MILLLISVRLIDQLYNKLIVFDLILMNMQNYLMSFIHFIHLHFNLLASIIIDFF
jgi:hypothetical protein